MQESFDSFEEQLSSIIEKVVTYGGYMGAAILSTWFVVGSIVAVILTIRSAVRKSRH